MSQHVSIPWIDDFDPSTCAGAALRMQLERLTKRLNGLYQRREDLEQFKIDLQKEKPYVTIAVQANFDKEKGYILERHFYMPLEAENAYEQMVSLTANSERVLREEIEFVKERIRKVLESY